LEYNASIPVTVSYQTDSESVPITVLYHDFKPTSNKTLKDQVLFADSGFFNTQDYVDTQYFAEDYAGIVYVF